MIAGAVLRSETQFTRLSALGKVERAEFPARAHAGDTIELTVEIRGDHLDGLKFRSEPTACLTRPIPFTAWATSMQPPMRSRSCSHVCSTRSLWTIPTGWIHSSNNRW